MSMGEILEVLVSKAKLEAEDAQRVLLGALNGLAALMLLENSPAQTALAIKTYREVICSSDRMSYCIFLEGHVLWGVRNVCCSTQLLRAQVPADPYINHQCCSTNFHVFKRPQLTL